MKSTPTSEPPDCRCKINKKCNAIISEYKVVCDLAWDAKCGKINSRQYNQKVKNLSEKCSKFRIDYQVNCCPCRDKGHTGAITKMKKKVKACEQELSGVK
jgi:hypothetical protein